VYWSVRPLLLFFFRFGFCLARSSGKISLSVWFQPAFSSVSLKVQN
jgi:hypothetical protein